MFLALNLSKLYLHNFLLISCYPDITSQLVSHNNIVNEINYIDSDNIFIFFIINVVR